jgi:GNAT superfamily N-acetyltransferase
MNVEVTPITRRRELRQFMHLPARLHRDHSRWVPPIYADERRFLNPEKNRAFSYSDTTLALAWRNTTLVGRIMGIINRRCNELRNERTGRFGLLESIEDENVAFALLDYIEDWARTKGMNKITGPMGFNDHDPEGFLVEGFEHEPTIATYYNFEYILRFLEAKGYSREVDYVVYKVNVPDAVPELYEKISKRLSTRNEFRLLEFRRRKDVKPYARSIVNLMNEEFRDLYGFVPLDEEEARDLARRYLPLIDPRFLKTVAKDDRIIAFVLGIPNMNDGLRKAKGRLFPFGIFQILRAAKRSKQLDLLLGAIEKEYRGRGLDVMLGGAMMRSAIDAGFECIDSHHELETNTRIRAEMERVGGKVYKRFRIFQKQL